MPCLEHFGKMRSAKCVLDFGESLVCTSKSQNLAEGIGALLEDEVGKTH